MAQPFDPDAYLHARSQAGVPYTQLLQSQHSNALEGVDPKMIDRGLAPEDQAHLDAISATVAAGHEPTDEQKNQATILLAKYPFLVQDGRLPKPDISTGVSLARGAAQGATLGWEDELKGLAHLAAKMDLPHALGGLSEDQISGEIGQGMARGESPTDAALGLFKRLYEQGRDLERAKDKIAADAHPVAHGIGEVGGGILGTIGAAALAPETLGTEGLSALPRAARLARLAKVGAGIGAVAGLGNGEGPAPRQALSTLMGAGIGAVAPVAIDRVALPIAGAVGRKVALPLARKALSGLEFATSPTAVASKLRGAAGRLATEALGPNLPQLRALEVHEDPSQFGQTLLRNGIVPFGLGWQNPAEVMEHRAARAAQRAGEGILSTLDTLDELNPGAIQPSAVRRRMVQSVVRPLVQRLPEGGTESKFGVPESIPNALRAEIRKLRTPDDAMGFRQSNQAINQIDEEIGGRNWDNPDVQMLAARRKQLRGVLRDEQRQAAEATQPELAAQLEREKKNYGTFVRAAKIAEDKAARLLRNRKMAPSDYAVAIGTAIQAGGGTEPGSGVAGLLAGYGHKLIRERGNAFFARTFWELANRLDAEGNEPLGRIVRHEAALAIVPQEGAASSAIVPHQPSSPYDVLTPRPASLPGAQAPALLESTVGRGSR